MIRLLPSRPCLLLRVNAHFKCCLGGSWEATRACRWARSDRLRNSERERVVGICANCHTLWLKRHRFPTRFLCQRETERLLFLSSAYPLTLSSLINTLRGHTQTLLREAQPSVCRNCFVLVFACQSLSFSRLPSTTYLAYTASTSPPAK